MAYKATERRHLLSAINEFLDFSIVLPPGDWETQALLPFTELKEKNEKIRRRQSRVQDETKATESKGFVNFIFDISKVCMFFNNGYLVDNKFLFYMLHMMLF